VNLARSVSNGNPTIVPVSAGTQHSFTMNASNTFRIYLQLGSTNYDLEGVFRQDGATTKSAVCQVYGYALTL
jgi:hypothetical protein